MRKNLILLTFLLILISTVSFASSYKGLGKGSVPEVVIRQFAPPALDPVLKKKIQNMLDVRSAGLGIISPDGKSLYFTWRVTGVVQVWRVDGPDTFPIQLTGGEDQTYVEEITPDGKWLIVSRDQNGEENPGLYLLNPKGGPLLEIQKKKDVQTRFESVSDDSKWIYFSANDIKSDSYAIYRYNIDAKQKELVFNEPGIWAISDDRDDQVFLLQKSKGAAEYEYWEFNLQTKKLMPVIGQDEDAEYFVKFSSQENEYFILTPKFANFRSLYLYKDKKFTPVTGNLSHDVSNFNVDEQKKTLYYVVNEEGYSKVFAKNARTLKDLPLPKFDAVNVFFGNISKSARYVTFGVDTYHAPLAGYVFDWKTKKLTRWINSSTPEIDTSRFAESALEYYPARDGTKIPMFVKRPENCKNKTCPVVVDFHGGPEAQSTPGFSLMEQLYVDEGFVYVSPNVRGSDGYGKQWMDADNREKRLQVITDVEDCATFIKKNWAFDGVVPKVGVFGGSYGGYTTLFAMTYFSGAYDAGASVVGMSDLVTFINNTAPYRRILRMNEYGDPIKDKDAMIKLSPITHIKKVKDPLLVIQGVNDPRVPVGEAIQMHRELVKKNIPTGLILFSDEGHGASKRENVVQEIGHMISFFKKYLK
jgi:dipeptidyl aminopeptidase/acylaminoacyl peptidase